jgi:dimethylargininase
MIALTREVSPALAACELTHLRRVPIDVDLARHQHDAYEAALRAAGCSVERLAVAPDLPDSVFVEDIAVVLPELAIITRPGAESRRREAEAVAGALGRYRPLQTIQAPGTIDGGDVLVVGRSICVGRSSRTNADAVAQMRRMLRPYAYTVSEIEVHGCLHLKSAVTAVDDEMLLVNPAWVAPRSFAGANIIEVAPDEPAGANALRVGRVVVYPSAFVRTAERLSRHGLTLAPVDVSELAKAEGAVTCCSIIIDDTKDTKGTKGTTDTKDSRR